MIAFMPRVAPTQSPSELADGTYHFQLYTTDSSYSIADLTPQTVTNTDGKFAFQLNYTPADAGSTFYYLLQEENSGQTIDGVAYDGTVYRIRVLVEDDGLGGLKASFYVNDGPENPDEYNFAFVNTVIPPDPPVPEEPTPVTPETGDHTNLTLLTALTLGSMSALIVLLLAGKKKETAQ